MVRELLDLGADPDIPTREGLTATDLALSAGSPTLADLIQAVSERKGAFDVNKNQQYKVGF